jgi:GMP synthase-like glutamine amidotransferase
MIVIIDMNWKVNSLGYFEFVKPILTVAEKLDKCIIKHYSEFSQQDLDACDRIILSGTALQDNEFLKELERFQWLKEIQKPVLGICAGMEATAAVFGAKLFKSLEIGMTDVNVLKSNELVSKDFKAYSLHSFCVEPSDVFEIWAKSIKCAQIIKHKTSPIYGVLFHPEVRNEIILRDFIVKK